MSSESAILFSIFLASCFFGFVFLKIRRAIRRRRIERNMDKFLKEQSKK